MTIVYPVSIWEGVWESFGGTNCNSTHVFFWVLKNPPKKERSTKRSTRMYKKVHYYHSLLDQSCRSWYSTVVDLNKNLRYTCIQRKVHFFVREEPTCQSAWLRPCIRHISPQGWMQGGVTGPPPPPPPPPHTHTHTHTHDLKTVG